METKKILCLDLDGTVRRSKSGKTFIEGPDDVEIIPGMRELLIHYHNLGYILVAISNQGGVAHGHKTPNEVRQEMLKTFHLLKNNEGVHMLNVLKWCPYAAEGTIEDFNFRSLTRKPSIGMLVLIERDLLDRGVIPDWDNSLFVGDRPEDQQCAQAAGIPFMWAEEFLKQPIPELQS